MNQDTDVFKGQNLRDPFDGGDVKISRVSGGRYWMAYGKRWSSALFDTRQALVHFLSTRDGVPPPFAAEPKIEVSENVEPGDKGQSDDDDRRTLNEAANAAIDRLVHVHNTSGPVRKRGPR